MSEDNQELAIASTAAPLAQQQQNGEREITARELRTTHVGDLLHGAYQRAAQLQLTSSEVSKLRAEFPDDAVRIRPHDGAIYIPHILLRERLWSVFGPTEVAEICREKTLRAETNEVLVDLVLLIRGAFAAEGIGTAEYIVSNRNMSYGDVIEAAWSDALRRCCKKIGVGAQIWRPNYDQNWKLEFAETYGKTNRDGKKVTMWRLKSDEAQRQYIREELAEQRPTATEWDREPSFREVKETMQGNVEPVMDWRDVPIHFGKNGPRDGNPGRKLGELTPQQLHWYANDWLDEKLIGKGRAPSPDDKALIGALVTYRREHQAEKAMAEK